MRFHAEHPSPRVPLVQGLAWMQAREAEGHAHGRGLLQLHPNWLQLQCADKQLIYMHRLRPHVLSTSFFPAPVGGTCGGACSDDPLTSPRICGWHMWSYLLS